MIDDPAQRSSRPAAPGTMRVMTEPSSHAATPHPAALDDERLLADCEAKRTRRSGPGGQHRNKTDTAVVLTHRPTGVTAEGSERRSQKENHSLALKRLRWKLAAEHREPIEGRSVPSDLWRSRLQGRRIVVSPKHADCPALLAEALDVIEAHDSDVKAAAEQLNCSVSQLVKLLKEAPETLQRINERRKQRGEPTLK